MGDTNAHGNPGPGPRGRVVQEGGEMSIEEQGAARRAALAAEEEFEEKVRLLVLRAVGSPPPWGLDAAHELRILAGHLLHQQIMDARERGWSWGRIARVLGISRQALHRRPCTSGSAGPPIGRQPYVGRLAAPRLAGRCASPS